MIHPANVIQGLKKHVVTFTIADGDAGADLADIPVFRCPCALEIVEVGIIPQGDDDGVDDDNTSKVDIEVGDTALASKTYTDDFPDAGVYDSLGAIASGTREEGDVVTVSVTNGTTANPPACTLQIEYIVRDEALFDAEHVV